MDPVRALRSAAEAGDGTAREVLRDAVGDYPQEGNPKPGEWYCIFTYGYHYYGEVAWCDSNYIGLKGLAWCVFDLGPFGEAFPESGVGTLKYAERLIHGARVPHNTIQLLIPVAAGQPKVESES